MPVKLINVAYEHAVKLIKAGEVESFDADWSEVAPTPDEVLHFLNSHSMHEYGLWFLGRNSQFPDSAKEHYIYPHGDLKEVQTCALEETLNKAETNGDAEIAQAAKQLLAMID